MSYITTRTVVGINGEALDAETDVPESWDTTSEFFQGLIALGAVRAVADPSLANRRPGRPPRFTDVGGRGVRRNVADGGA